MTEKEKAPAATAAKGIEASPNHTTPKKWQRVLRAFLAGRSYNRFEAERELSDHCLHSTVSTLQGMGIGIHRKFETVPGYQRIPTRVRRYWLSPESAERAVKLLERVR